MPAAAVNGSSRLDSMLITRTLDALGDRVHLLMT
jgi:hypothetical protein